MLVDEIAKSHCFWLLVYGPMIRYFFVGLLDQIRPVHAAVKERHPQLLSSHWFHDPAMSKTPLLSLHSCVVGYRPKIETILTPGKSLSSPSVGTPSVPTSTMWNSRSSILDQDSRRLEGYPVANESLDNSNSSSVSHSGLV